MRIELLVNDLQEEGAAGGTDKGRCGVSGGDYCLGLKIKLSVTDTGDYFIPAKLPSTAFASHRGSPPFFWGYEKGPLRCSGKGHSGEAASPGEAGRDM